MHVTRACVQFIAGVALHACYDVQASIRVHSTARHGTARQGTDAWVLHANVHTYGRPAHTCTCLHLRAHAHTT